MVHTMPDQTDTDARIEARPERFKNPGEAHNHGIRLLGVTAGLASAVLRVRGQMTRLSPPYSPLPKHWRRRIASREAQVQPLRDLESWLLLEIKRIQLAYREHLSDGAPTRQEHADEPNGMTTNPPLGDDAR
jgi:hypothetical protein